MNTQTMPREAVTVQRQPSASLPATIKDDAPVLFTSPHAHPKAYPAKIAKALIAISREVKGVPKDGYNSFHQYHYQKWDDVLDKLSPLLNEHELLVQQSEVSRNLLENLIAITYEFTIVNGDGDVWPDRPNWTAIARMRDTKGVMDDKAANKCHTQASKYFLLHLFKIRTRETAADDADTGANGAQAPARKPPNPNAPAADIPSGPRALATDGHSYQSFADAYVAAALTSKTPADVKEWELLNNGALEKLQRGNPDVFVGLCSRVAEHVAKLVRASKPKPPNPNGTVARHPDVDRVEAGRDDGSTVTWGDGGEDVPGFLLREKQQLVSEIAKLEDMHACFAFSQGFETRLAKLPATERKDVRQAFINRQAALNRD